MKRDVFWPLVAMSLVGAIGCFFIGIKDGLWGLYVPGAVCAAIFVLALRGRPISGSEGNGA